MRTIPAFMMACLAGLLLTACGGDSGGTATAADLAGSWGVDTDALKKSFSESEAIKNIPEAMRPKVMEGIGNSTYTVVIKADGTWTSSGTLGPTEQQERGTWTLDGNKITVLVTHEDGKALAKPNTIRGEVDGDVIRARQEGDDDAPLMQLKRK